MPKSKIAAVTSVVVMGRRMKISKRSLGRSPGLGVVRTRNGLDDFHLEAWNQAKLPVGDHGFTGRDSLGHDGFVTDGAAHRQDAHFYGLVGFHYKGVLACWPV